MDKAMVDSVLERWYDLATHDERDQSYNRLRRVLHLLPDLKHAAATRLDLAPAVMGLSDDGLFVVEPAEHGFTVTRRPLSSQITIELEEQLDAEHGGRRRHARSWKLSWPAGDTFHFTSYPYRGDEWGDPDQAEALAWELAARAGWGNPDET